MEFAEGSWARPMVSIVLTKECVLTQDNKAYRDEVLSNLHFKYHRLQEFSFSEFSY